MECASPLALSGCGVKKISRLDAAAGGGFSHTAVNVMLCQLLIFQNQFTLLED